MTTTLREKALAEVAEALTALPVQSRADDEIPDDKEEAYQKGYADALEDAIAAVKALIPQAVPADTDPCPRCEGTGRVKHECNLHPKTLVKRLPVFRDGATFENTVFLRCTCGKLFKHVNGYTRGLGCIDVRLAPGESRDGRSFPLEEAEAIRRELEQKEAQKS